jgi:hypothetical protein
MNDQESLLRVYAFFEGTMYEWDVELKTNFKFMALLIYKSDFSLLLKNLGAQNPVYNGVLCYGEDYQTIQG